MLLLSKNWSLTQSFLSSLFCDLQQSHKYFSKTYLPRFFWIWNNSFILILPYSKKTQDGTFVFPDVMIFRIPKGPSFPSSSTLFHFVDGLLQFDRQFSEISNCWRIFWDLRYRKNQFLKILGVRKCSANVSTDTYTLVNDNLLLVADVVSNSPAESEILKKKWLSLGKEALENNDQREMRSVVIIWI